MTFPSCWFTSHMSSTKSPKSHRPTYIDTCIYTTVFTPSIAVERIRNQICQCTTPSKIGTDHFNHHPGSLLVCIMHAPHTSYKRVAQSNSLQIPSTLLWSVLLSCCDIYLVLETRRERARNIYSVPRRIRRRHTAAVRNPKHARPSWLKPRRLHYSLNTCIICVYHIFSSSFHFHFLFRTAASRAANLFIDIHNSALFWAFQFM